jgi:hypothetical protein
MGHTGSRAVSRNEDRLAIHCYTPRPGNRQPITPEMVEQRLTELPTSGRH